MTGPGGAAGRVLAVCNQKGGVGKTTTAVNLAASLAAAEHRVLVVDLDPQGNASSSVGYPRGGDALGTYELLLGEASLDEVALPTELPTLEVVPADVSLAGAEIELVQVEGRETILSRAFRAAEARERWDFVVIDCPPSLGILTINALAAADAVIIPMLARYFSLEGLGALTETVARVREALNPELAVEGILFCMYDPRPNLSKQVVQEVREHFPELVYETFIPQNVRLGESPSHGKPALLYDIESRGAQAYLNLAREVLQRIAQRAEVPA